MSFPQWIYIIIPAYYFSQCIKNIYFNFQLFDPIRKERPNDLHKVLSIEGDITQPELAINSNDRSVLARNVNIVFHSAATVKFDEKLKLSVTINMLGTQRLVELCKRMEHLEALVSKHSLLVFVNFDETNILINDKLFITISIWFPRRCCHLLLTTGTWRLALQNNLGSLIKKSWL